MLKLTTITNCIFNKDHWQHFDLHMTPSGFTQLSDQLNSFDQLPQVYIHVGNEGCLKNKVLRIGKAESGIKNRWIKDSNGHMNTFLWAIGESKKYGKKNAKKYPKYLLFFAGLFKLKTKLYILNCEKGTNGKAACRASEEALIGHFSPTWQYFRKYEKFEPNYPLLSGKNKDTDFHTLIEEHGGALKAIYAQREGREIFSKQIPDVIKFCNILKQPIGKIESIQTICEGK